MVFEFNEQKRKRESHRIRWYSKVRPVRVELYQSLTFYYLPKRIRAQCVSNNINIMLCRRVRGNGGFRTKFQTFFFHVVRLPRRDFLSPRPTAN